MLNNVGDIVNGQIGEKTPLWSYQWYEVDEKKKFVLDEQISEINEKITVMEYELNLIDWKTDSVLIKMALSS